MVRFCYINKFRIFRITCIITKFSYYNLFLVLIVHLQAHENYQILGLMMQVANTSQIAGKSYSTLGYFQVEDKTLSLQTVRCQNQDDTLTHRLSDGMKEVNVVWKQPKDFRGEQLHFVYRNSCSYYFFLLHIIIIHLKANISHAILHWNA